MVHVAFVSLLSVVQCVAVSVLDASVVVVRERAELRVAAVIEVLSI